MITFLAHYGWIAVPLNVALLVVYTYFVLRIGYGWGMRELEFRKLNMGFNALASHKGGHARKKKRPVWTGRALAIVLGVLKYLITFAWLRSFIAWARDYMPALKLNALYDDDEHGDETADFLDKTERFLARTGGMHPDD